LGLGDQRGDLVEGPSDALNIIVGVHQRQRPGVVPGSPAAGTLEPGDILRAVAGPRVAGHGLGPAVLDELASHKAGSVVRLLVQRGSTLSYVTIRLGTLADPKAVNAGNNLPISTSTPEYMI
jgi:S1-C subfamily serine protease